MEYDFNVLERQITSIYRNYHSEMKWDLSDYLEVFHTFTRYYRWYRGKSHPFLTNEQVLRVMLALPTLEDEENCSGVSDGYDMDPEDYEALIEKYFETRFKRECNYSILHFISGDIRALRFYETLY